MCQRQEGERQQHELGEGGRRGHRHQGAVAPVGAIEGDAELNDRRRERQDEREMADLGDHRVTGPSSTRACAGMPIEVVGKFVIPAPSGDPIVSLNSPKSGHAVIQLITASAK